MILFAIPKTGTTALEEAVTPLADSAILNPPGMKHCNIRKYERELAPFFESKGREPMERVAVVREPFSWLGSWYRYRARPALDNKPNSTAKISFDKFVEDWLQDTPPPHARIGTQARFLDAVSDGVPRVDHLFRYEALGVATAFLQERIGWDIQLSRANVSEKRDLVLADAIAQRVRDERPEEFMVWNAARQT